MFSTIRRELESRERGDRQHLSVSVTRAPSITEHTLTAAQTQNRLAVSTTRGSKVLRLHSVCLGNLPLHNQGSSLDVMS